MLHSCEWCVCGKTEYLYFLKPFRQTETHCSRQIKHWRWEWCYMLPGLEQAAILNMKFLCQLTKSFCFSHLEVIFNHVLYVSVSVISIFHLSHNSNCTKILIFQVIGILPTPLRRLYHWKRSDSGSDY